MPSLGTFHHRSTTMAIEILKRVDTERGPLIQWHDADRLVGSATWPDDFSAVAPDLDNAAHALVNGMHAAGNELTAAVQRFKQQSDHEKQAGESIVRHVVPAFKRLREAALAARDAFNVATASLDAPITPEASQTPASAAVAHLAAQEIREIVDGIETHAAAYDWVIRSEGTDVLNAVAPFIHLTRFDRLPEMRKAIIEEFRVRKMMRTVNNTRNDVHSTAADPLKVTMSDDTKRTLSTAEVGAVTIKGEAVESATRLLRDTIGFVHRAMGLQSEDEAFRVLMGDRPQ